MSGFQKQEEDTKRSLVQNGTNEQPRRFLRCGERLRFRPVRSPPYPHHIPGISSSRVPFRTRRYALFREPFLLVVDESADYTHVCLHEGNLSIGNCTRCCSVPSGEGPLRTGYKKSTPQTTGAIELICDSRVRRRSRGLECLFQRPQRRKTNSACGRMVHDAWLERKTRT